MNDFGYAAPTTVEDAVGILSSQGDRTRLLAGGTDILVQLREGLREAELVLDVKKIPELMQLAIRDGGQLVLGASVSCFQIYQNAEIVRSFPALADAAHIVGGWQIQSRASVGGNLCNASPAADTIPPLIVHNTVCEIASAGGRRELSVCDFCVAPGKNALESGELLVSLRLEACQANEGSAYQRFIPRNEMDIAVAGAASWLRLNAAGDIVEDARIALAAVAPTPVFASEASEWLQGKPATQESFAKAGELASNVAAPITDMRGTADYRKHLAGVLTKRTLATAAERARTSD